MARSSMFVAILVSCRLSAWLVAAASCESKDGGACDLPTSGGNALLQRTTKQAKGKVEDEAEHKAKHKAKHTMRPGAKLIHGVPVYGFDRATLAGTPMGQKRVALVQDTDQADWIISLGPNTTDTQLADFCVAIVSFGAECYHDNGHPSEGGVPFDVFRASPTQLEQILEQYPNAEFVEHDDLIELDDPLEPPTMITKGVNSAASSVPWGLDRIDSDAIDYSYTSPGAQGAGAHVYVLDTGVRTTHSDFEGRAIPTLESLGTIIECADSDTSCAYDGHGHGTHCSGTIAGKEYGVAKQATIHAVKVLNPSGATSWITGAMDWVIQYGIRPGVMSMSLGGSGVSEAYRVAVNTAVAAGVTVVVAAGNSNDDACNYRPAFVPAAITVGSTTSGDEMSYFSNFGSCVDIFAPGSSIVSAGNNDDYGSATMSGTSMACPHVAGATAILLGEFPDLQPSGILSSLLLAAMPGAVDLVPESPASPNMLLRVSDATSPPTPPTTSPTAHPTPPPTPAQPCLTAFSRAELPEDWCNGISAWAICQLADGWVDGSGYGCGIGPEVGKSNSCVTSSSDPHCGGVYKPPHHGTQGPPGPPGPPGLDGPAGPPGPPR